MDHFGIGAGVAAVTEVYFRSGRRSGRTTSLVESVKDGDRIVFADRREAQRVERLCKERGVKVECLVIDPSTSQRLFEKGTAEGRTMLDHTWVETYYRDAIARAQQDIDHFERQTSGYGAAHRETANQFQILHRQKFER